MIVAIAIDGVFGQGALAPCIDAAYTMNIEVDVEVDKLSSLQFAWVSHIKVFLTIVPCTNAEWLASIDAQRAVI